MHLYCCTHSTILASDESFHNYMEKPTFLYKSLEMSCKIAGLQLFFSRALLIMDAVFNDIFSQRSCH